MDQLISEDIHHRQALLEGGRFGGFICVLRGEKEEEAFWGRGGSVVEEGGGADAEVWSCMSIIQRIACYLRL